MKKSISYWSFSGKNVFQAMQTAKDAGFDGIELTLDAEGEARIRRGAPVYLMRPAGRYRLYGPAGGFLGLGVVRETDRRPELMIEKGMME